MFTQIQMRQGNSEDWRIHNPILKSGEHGYDLEVKKFKIGDGVTPWNDLDWHINEDAMTNQEIDDIVNNAFNEK